MTGIKILRWMKFRLRFGKNNLKKRELKRECAVREKKPRKILEFFFSGRKIIGGETGPCGPCSEMFYDVRPEQGSLKGKTHEEWVDDFRIMEIWNDVFMEFNKLAPGSFEKMALVSTG